MQDETRVAISRESSANKVHYGTKVLYPVAYLCFFNLDLPVIKKLYDTSATTSNFFQIEFQIDKNLLLFTCSRNLRRSHSHGFG